MDLSNLSSQERDKLLLLLKNTRLDPHFTEFEPTTPQGAFLLSNANETLFIAGNQSGKSEAGCVQILMWATGEYPEWYPQELHIPTPNRGRVCGADLKNWVSEILEPKLRRWLPPKYVKEWKKNPQTKSLDQIVFTNGSVIDILSYQQEQISFESWTGNWAWCDEPPKRDQYIALIRGLAALNGRVILTMTPLSEPWVYQLVDACKDTKEFGSIIYHEGSRKQDSSKIRVVTATTDDNLQQLNWRGKMAGGMSKEGLAFFLSTLSADEEQVRRYGRFVHLQGLVYKEVNEAVHVLDDNLVAKQGTMYCSLDPADAKPHAVSWYRVDPLNTAYCVLALEIDGNLDDLAKAIKQVEDREHWVVQARILDPNKGKTPTSVTRRTWQEELADRGLYFETEVNDDIAFGHQVVRGRLAWDKTKEMSETNHPKLYFAREGAAPMIFALKNYVYDTNLNKDKHDTYKEKPRDKYKDFPDTLRYAAVYGLEYREPFDDGIELYNPDNFLTSRSS